MTPHALLQCPEGKAGTQDPRPPVSPVPGAISPAGLHSARPQPGGAAVLMLCSASNTRSKTQLSGHLFPTGLEFGVEGMGTGLWSTAAHCRDVLGIF